MVVAAAANELRESSAPLVCTEGQPTAAVHVLLRQLTASGARLVYHGDFDWAGIQIANLMIRRHNTVPWRMSVRDYEEVATGSLALEGSPVVASWEPELTKSMMRVGRAVHEEQVIEFLLQDLRSSSSRSAIQAKSAPAS
jgi:uncharacterized protein (TIGR02679 family)